MPYAALSYCWGGHLPLRTTRLNVDKHRDAISWTALPRTFQDAISVTRKLSISYIWIDSLCIIQDDTEDWEQEAVLMANVYQYAIITLSAATAKNPTEGLFKETTTETVLDLKDKCSGRSVPLIYVRSPNHEESREHVLFSRAWVYQERLLSTRVLHFGSSELVWECMEKRGCECGAQNWKNWMQEKALSHPKTLKRQSLAQSATSWRRTVNDFAAMRLTNSNDVFPAISGIARRMSESVAHRGVKPVYIAGLWQHSFVQDCCWFALSPGARPKSYTAPSFSWASIIYGTKDKGSTWYWHTVNETSLELLAKLVSFGRHLGGPDAMGRLLDAHAVLCGTLVDSMVHYSRVYGREGVRCELRLESPNVEVITSLYPDYAIW